MKEKFFLILAVITISGCAMKKMTREEWLNTTTRIYKGTTKEKVIAQAEKILLMADESDMNIIHRQDGFIATRSWSIYLVISAAFGTDYWDVKVKELGNGEVEITTLVSNSNATGTAIPNGNNGASPLTIPTNLNYIQGNSLYSLFYSRLDYLMGKEGAHWNTCERHEKISNMMNFFGTIEPLCQAFTTNDPLPDHMSESEIDYQFNCKKDQRPQNDFSGNWPRCIDAKESYIRRQADINTAKN